MYVLSVWCVVSVCAVCVLPLLRVYVCLLFVLSARAECGRVLWRLMNVVCVPVRVLSSTDRLHRAS